MVLPVRGEHDGPAGLDESVDAGPQRAAGFGVHPSGRLILRTGPQPEPGEPTGEPGSRARRAGAVSDKSGGGANQNRGGIANQRRGMEGRRRNIVRIRKVKQVQKLLKELEK